MKIKQTEKYEGQDWWNWSVWIDGNDVANVAKVTWKLHPTFPQPEREISDASTKFRLDSAGWGAFVVKADVLLKNGTKQELEHELELHYPDGTRTEK
jgi:transcription initiation factor IIF auxiliary subunit